MARILVIDDNDTMREGMAVTLKKAGHEVLAFRSGAEGVTAWTPVTPEGENCGIPAWRPDGALTVGWRMKVTMTCDHRVIDGALGARFLAALRGYVELPAMMAL
jgi:pyruvate/2-oxoglutarate dehydrogenase complex dihydrolipoamide acyltransferase (E2) component